MIHLKPLNGFFMKHVFFFFGGGVDFNGRNGIQLDPTGGWFIRTLEMVLESQREILDQVTGRKAWVWSGWLVAWWMRSDRSWGKHK